nr:ADP-ribose glycohydrolase OARD1 isoform X3 [Chrysemys picta bellii]
MEVAIFDVLLDCTKAGRGLFRNGVYPRRGLSFGLNLQRRVSRRNPGNSLTLPWPVPPPGIRQTESEKKSGEVAVLKRDDRYIYYLITKKKVSHKPTYENMQKSLEAMKTHCLNNGVTDISMPRIGCGLDRLEWDKVSALLEEVFEDTDIKITVYAL